MKHLLDIRQDDRVRAFDPHSVGVVRHAKVLRVGRKYAHLDFGLHGQRRVARRDILEVTE